MGYAESTCNARVRKSESIAGQCPIFGRVSDVQFCVLLQVALAVPTNAAASLLLQGSLQAALFTIFVHSFFLHLPCIGFICFLPVHGVFGPGVGLPRCYHLLQDALEAHTWNKNAAANYLLQGGSSLPPLPALRRSTTDRNSTYSPTAQPGKRPLRLSCLPRLEPRRLQLPEHAAQVTVGLCTCFL